MVTKRKAESNGHSEQPTLNMEEIRFREKELIANALFSRTEFFRKLLDPRRDIDAECGYPVPTIQTYRDLYDREPIAARVVEVLPKESWQSQPSVYEDEDSEQVTEFEKAWDELAQTLRGESWYQDEEGSPIWEHLRRADIESGIGHYGIILLGLDDGKSLETPVEFVTTKREGDNGGVEVDSSLLGTEAQYNRPLYDPIGTRRTGVTVNTFCPTGEGGGIDPTCSSTGLSAGDTWPNSEIYRTGVLKQLQRRGIEQAFVLDQKGEMLASGTGETNVSINANTADFDGAYSVHGHPRRESFSDADLLTAQRFGLARTEIVHTNGDIEILHLGKSAVGYNEVQDAIASNPRADSGADVSRTEKIAKSLGWKYRIEKSSPTTNLAPVYSSKKTKRKLLFVRSFDESLAQIIEYEADLTSPRFGQPVMYQVTLNDPRNNESTSSVGLTTATYKVHWTRVIHVADNLGTSEIFGIPRMQQVFNRLCDLRKLYGGSGEMYWRGAFPGLSVETNPQLGGDVQLDQAGLRAQMQDYMNGLQRYLALTGMSAKSLAPQVVDPTPQIKVQLESICILLGIPMRIFMGSERGELASGQDDSTWNGRLKDRQCNYLTPRMIIPFVDRLIMVGVLSEPDGYSVVWPDLDSLKPLEQATLAGTRTEALAKYVGGGIDALISPMDYLTRELGYDEEEAVSILEATQSHLEEANPDAETIVAGTPPKQPTPEPTPNPIKMKEGEKLVDTDGNPLTNEGANCGVGDGGFQPGNTCAKGGGGDSSSQPSVTPSVEVDKSREEARNRRGAVLKKNDQHLRSNRRLADPPSITGPDGAKAVETYTGNDQFTKINGALRGGKGPNSVPPKPDVANLQKLTQQPLKEPTIVYRGVSVEVANNILRSKNREAVVKGFNSTSLSPEVATEFGKVVLEIKAKRGLYVNDYSQFKKEYELVQSHNTKYKVLGVEKGVKIGKSTVHVVRLEEID